MLHVTIQSIVGGLIYLSNGTRPDIQFATNQLCKYMSNATEKHLILAKRILRYLQRTKNNYILFSSNCPSIISIFTDADFSNDKIESKSTTGMVVLNRGNLIRWSSKAQDSVALSTCEAEINAIREATADAIYFRGLLGEIGKTDIFPPIEIVNDNMSAIKTLESNGKWARNRHYLIKINFIRFHLQKEHIKLSFSRSETMLADPMTKSLTENKIQFLLSKCGLVFD
jgi:hypothetical protein